MKKNYLERTDKIMDNKEINKPILLCREEFTKNLVKLINESQLPVFIVEYILKDILSEVHTATQQEFESEKQTYEKQIKELSKNSETNK